MNKWLARQLSKGDKTLVGFWPLLDNSLDYSGKSFHGTPALTELQKNFGLIGYKFASLDSPSIDCGFQDELNFDTTSKFSLGCWIVRLLDGQGPVLSKNQGSGSASIGYQLYIGTDHNVYFRLSNTSGAIVVKANLHDSSILDQPFQVYVSYDGSGQANGVSLYINGKVVDKTIDTDTLTGNITNTESFKIGRGLTGGFPSYFDGIIAIARLFKREINSDDVTEFYSQEKKEYFRRSSYKYFPLAGASLLTRFLLSPTASVTWSAIAGLKSKFELFGSSNQSPNDPQIFTGKLGTNRSYLRNFVLGHHGIFDEMNYNIPLFIQGIPDPFNFDDSLDLYTLGHASLNSNIPLYTTSNTTNKSITLYIKTGELGRSSGNFPLFTWSTTNSGLYDYIPLYLEAISGNRPNDKITLYVEGGGSAKYNSKIDLFVKGQNYSIDDNIPLFLYQQGTAGTLPLYLRGDGNGLVPGTQISASIDLFIKRLKYAEMLNLYIASWQTNSGVLSLVGKGHAISSGVLPLVIANTHHKVSGVIPCYVHGF